MIFCRRASSARAPPVHGFVDGGDAFTLRLVDERARVDDQHIRQIGFRRHRHPRFLQMSDHHFGIDQILRTAERNKSDFDHERGGRYARARVRHAELVGEALDVWRTRFLIGSLMRKLATVVTPYQRVAVWGSDGEREFRVAGATHAWWHRDFLLTGLAWDNMAAAALLGLNGPPQSLLMLGLAGGTTLRVLRHLLPGLQMAAVEIDPDIVALARDHMDLDRLGVDVHIGDAYEWLRHSRRKFDVVVDDVYGVTPDDVVRPGLYDESARRAIAAGSRPADSSSPTW